LQTHVLFYLYIILTWLRYQHW